MQATLDRSGCIGCGLCATTCPEVFHMADDGLAQVAAQPTPATIERAKEAAEGCPVNVIEINEE